MNKGFSIIEAVVILATVAVLGSLVYSRYKYHIAKSRQAEAKNNLNLIVSLQEVYILEHRVYHYLHPVGLDNSGLKPDGKNKHHCEDESTPGSGMLNGLGFRPRNCKELRYKYWAPPHTKTTVNGFDPHRTPQNFTPRFIVRADSNPFNTKRYIWPDCDSKDMWRASKTANSSNFKITQPVDGEFGNTGAQRRALENCK